MDISNGEGVGVALFVQGCHFHCYNCFNQETWDFESGHEWNKSSKNKFLELADREYIKRISILGGEPLADENIEGIFDVICTIKDRYKDSKKIWMHTGYTWDQIFPKIPQIDLSQNEIMRQLIVKQCDVVIDGRFVDNLKDISLKWRGSGNQRVIDVQNTIKSGEIALWEK